MSLLRFFVLLLGLAGPLGAAWAQTRPAAPATRPPAAEAPARPGAATPKPATGVPVKLLHAGILRGGVFNGMPIRKLIDTVSFQQGDVLLYCDSAYQYLDKNQIEAFNHVRIVQSDTLIITGNHGAYDGNQRTARITGDVVMTDPRMTLTTQALDYDLDRKTAFYTVGGHLVDPKNTLDSEQGFYDTNSKVFDFRRSVHLVSLNEKGERTDLRTDQLIFNTISKLATFEGPTYIQDQQSELYAERGTYNTITRLSNFERNAKITTPNYLLGGDQLRYDEKRLYGEANGHATLISKKDNVVLRGDQGRYWRALGRTKIFGTRPVVRSISGRDTLYLAADTLLSVESRPSNLKQRPILYAWPRAQLVRGRVQGRADSLTYDRQDSVIYLNRDPVLWQARNQLTSDSMNIRFLHGQLHKALLLGNAFAIQEDTIGDYNQVKGRRMVAYFQQSQLRRIDVLGNAESIYFTLEGDSVMSGMNKSVSASMTLRFADNKIKQLTWVTNPEASYTPPAELKAEEKQFKGFKWRAAERPTRRQVLGKHFASDLKKAPARKPRSKPKAKPKGKAKTAPRPRAKPKAAPKLPLPQAPAGPPVAPAARPSVPAAAATQR
ncbi:LPS export ABC transporter periplasmic protein LptC [Hymenobacter sp. RP-2-7]|uniref:LPS export ABC transporter periplasmic protein LptC n=1 Tax=Hymenobacter polaris TaxID=2682546 RepID=A0A7Y0FKT5_9BACT|nr:OstA-like protein [Hymenobacter polaris]NML64047.1 LPS export ABC transporter periplasmic protein LptC [Hymenobacter polaris]